MDFLTYLAVLVATTLIQRALAPKVRNPMPALEDFQLPTAEYGRPIPWLFGTRKIKDPNTIWYGDLDRHVKTKDGAKFYTYYMGLHLEICIGPVDAVYKLWYGDKVCWEGEQTASGLIQIEQPGLYGGRYKEGGIDGSFNLLFGEAGQGVNNYLEAQIGLPLSAFRDSFCIVGRKPALTANSTYIKPLLPLVKRIKKGWPDDDCWYPETAEIWYGSLYPYDDYAESLDLLCWWKCDGDSGNIVNIGRSSTGLTPSVGVTREAAHVTDATEDAQSVSFDSAASAESLLADEQVTGPFTIGVWVTPSNHPTTTAIFQTGFTTVDSVYRGVICYVLDDGSVNLIFGTGNGSGSSTYRRNYASIESIESIDERHLIVMTCNASAGVAGLEFAVYVDGVPFTMVHTGGTGSTIDWSAGKLSYGRLRWEFTAGNFEGLIDEPFFTDEILTEEQIDLLWQYGTTPVAPGESDMNPVHIIYGVWVDQHQGMAEDPASIDDTAMRYAADICYSEQLGLSLYWARQSTIEDFVAEVCRHAGLLQTINPRTGQLKIVALRDDYDVSSLDTLTEDEVIEVVEWQDAADGEAVNTITVRWVDWDGQDQATTYTNRASVQQHGVIAETRDYPGISQEALARRIAKRDVKESSSNLAKGKIKINRAAWDKFPGDVFIFSHAPEGIEELVLRVLEIDTGTLTDGAITLTVVQDVFSLPLDVSEISEQGNEWTTPSTDPAEATTATLMELPYWALLDVLGVAETGTLDDGAGYIAALAAKPSPLTTDIDIWARISPASYAEVRPEQACAPSATLVAALDRATDTDIDLDDLSQLEEVEAGWLVQIGTGALAELCRVTAIDVDLATVSVDRAILDTTPQEHAGGAPLFFLPDSASDWARDPTQYADGDTVDVKLQTGTASGELDLNSITAVAITMASRHVRPYPPGNILLEGSGEIYSPEPWPDKLLDTITVTWAHRDRVDQGATIVVQDDATDYGPESGTTYSVYLYNDETGDLLASQTGISGTTADIDTTETENHTARIEIASVRDGYECWQRQVRRFEHVPNGLLSDNDASPLATDGTGTVITRG